MDDMMGKYEMQLHKKQVLQGNKTQNDQMWRKASRHQEKGLYKAQLHMKQTDKIWQGTEPEQWVSKF